MGVERSSSIVIRSFPLGESDRVATFFTRDFGRVRGVARGARRLRSRFSGALELFTRGELVFFDTGRSDLVQVDHFDIVRPFACVREDLERLAYAAWMAECVDRLTAERDPNVAVFAGLARALSAVDTGVPAARVAAVFGLRLVSVLGHRLRLDACLSCGRRAVAAGGRAFIDVDAGGVVCAGCVTPQATRIAARTLGMLGRLGTMAWAEAVGTDLGSAEREIREVLETHVARLMGQPTRTSRFLREVIGTPGVAGGKR